MSGRHTACHFPRAVGQGGYDADGLLPACGHLHDIIDGRTPFWSLGRWLDEVGREVWELEFLAVSYVLRAKANYRFEAMDF